jgi:hypothetical protein
MRTGGRVVCIEKFLYTPTKGERASGLGPVTTVTNGNVVALSGNVLATHYCGVYENFRFDIADQQSNQMVNGTATVTEVFSNITNAPGPTPFTVSVPLATNGVADNHACGFTYPTCLTNSQNHVLNMTWTVQVGSTAYPITKSFTSPRETSMGL